MICVCCFFDVVLCWLCFCGGFVLVLIGFVYTTKIENNTTTQQTTINKTQCSTTKCGTL